jgi:prepilin signal peptidase PulO-like enzyme (type II secretory pathway)
MALFADAVDWGTLGEVVVASLVAGVGVTLFYSLAILGATRFADRRRAHKGGEAAGWALLGTLGLLACAAAVVFGIIVMTTKS